VVREALTIEKLSAFEPGEAAAVWIARRAEGLTDSEQKLFADWLARDPGNQRHLEIAERAWRNFDDAGDDELLGAMRAHALAPRARRHLRWQPFAAAAALLLAVIGAISIFHSPVTTLEYASVPGQIQEHTLADGSSLTLDGDSRLVSRFSDQQRAIELYRGRALFAVTSDPSRPFSVTAAGHRVVAVGTRFDVNLVAQALTVTLIEGEVKVEFPGSSKPPVTLTPGQQLVERGGSVEIRTLGAASEAATSWRTGLVTFDQQPLAEAIVVMNRYSTDQISIRDARVAALRVSGQFRGGDSQRFAETLAEMHGLRVVRQGKQIELVRAK
jgi:transmembrane sensor